MKNPLTTESSVGFGLLMARLPLGITLAFTGYHKIVGGGINQFVSENLPKVPHYMPAGFGNYYLHAVPVAELVVGVMLVVGFLTRVSGLVASLMLLSFALAMTGFFNAKSGDLPLTRPVAYMALALVALFVGPGRVSLDTWFWGKKSAA